MTKVLLELELEEAKELEMLLEATIYVSKHGTLPHINELQARPTMVPVEQLTESERKASTQIGMAKLEVLLEKLRKITSHFRGKTQ